MINGAKFQCPYCGHDNYFPCSKANVFGPAPVVCRCEAEDGGCDRPFALTVDWVPVAKVQRIEGEGEP